MVNSKPHDKESSMDMQFLHIVKEHYVLIMLMSDSDDQGRKNTDKPTKTHSFAQ